MSLLSIALIAVRAVISLYLAFLSLFLTLRRLTGDRYWPIALLNNSAPYVILPMLFVFPFTFFLGSIPIAIISSLLMLICAIWFAPFFLPKPRWMPVHPTLRIVTFNMWGGNPMQSELTSWLRSQNADVVFLQEVPLSFERTQIVALRSLYPYTYRQQTSGQWWTNAVLSKLPITSTIDLDENKFSPSTRQRITIEVSGQQIALYSIHLTFTKRKPRIALAEWSILHSITSFDDSDRNNELDCLLSELDLETLPYIVAGDFNMSAYSLTYRKASAKMHDTFREVGYGLGGTWPNSGVFNLPFPVTPLLRIDYVWHSAHFRAITAYVGPDIGSDHRPIIAELELLPTEV